jgi:hypothetical protein
LKGVNLDGIDFTEADLSLANLECASLRNSELVGTSLIGSNLKDSDITGACLYGSSRENWTIHGIKCDYIYFDPRCMVCTPEGRLFMPGEFEDLYKQLPTFEYYFEHGFSPVDAVIMDKVVQAINEEKPEIELKLDSFHSRGQPHAKFTVLHKKDVEEARKSIELKYEMRYREIEGKYEAMRECFYAVIKNPTFAIGALDMGDTYNINGKNITGLNVGSGTQIIKEINQTITESGVSGELETELKRLTDSVEKMVADMPEEKAKEVSRDLQTLVTEATSDKPRRKWYTLSGEGLIEAARAVGSLGKPVIYFTQSVLKMLGGV